jgi:hypothetical protein
MKYNVFMTDGIRCYDRHGGGPSVSFHVAHVDSVRRSLLDDPWMLRPFVAAWDGGSVAACPVWQCHR